MECKYYCVQCRITSSVAGVRWDTTQHNIHSVVLQVLLCTRTSYFYIRKLNPKRWTSHLAKVPDEKCANRHSPNTAQFFPAWPGPRHPPAPGHCQLVQETQHHIPRPGWKLGQGHEPLRHKLSLPSHRLSTSVGVAAKGCLTHQEHTLVFPLTGKVLLRNRRIILKQDPIIPWQYSMPRWGSFVLDV